MSITKINKLRKANSRINQRLGSIIVKDKSDFVSMLETCKVGFSGESYPELIDAYVEALPDNNKLQVCSAYLVELKDASNFDGVVENDNVYFNHKVIYNYWDWDWGNDNYDISGEDQSQFSAVGDVVLGVSKLGEKIIDSRRAKTSPASDIANKKAETKAQLLQTVIEAKKQEADQVKAKTEADSKRNRTLIIAGSVVAGLAIVGAIVYALRNK